MSVRIKNLIFSIRMFLDTRRTEIIFTQLVIKELFGGKESITTGMSKSGACNSVIKFSNSGIPMLNNIVDNVEQCGQQNFGQCRFHQL